MRSDMPRAIRTCSYVGCNSKNLKNGRCGKHPFQRYSKPWERETPYGQTVSNLVKNIVKYLADGKCARCGVQGDKVDHIIPRYLGGSDEICNLQLLCQPCHSDKTCKEALAAKKQKKENDAEVHSTDG
jgi:5-methylcytosine-specific restriction enzyme A